MKTGKFSARGHHVNVGNFDANGLNLKNWWDDNRNYNIGLAASQVIPPFCWR